MSTEKSTILRTAQDWSFAVLYVLVLCSLVGVAPAAHGQSSAGLFQQFVDRVSAASTGERAAIVDSFMATASFPFVEADTAVFIHRGNFSSVTVAGDMTGWNPSIVLSKLADTDLWYSRQTFESTARIDYKLIINGSSWILDPRNPNQVPGGFGPNSELAMLAYEQPAEIEYRDGITRGLLVDSVFASSTLGNSRRIQVYLPADYDGTSSHGTILFNDGTDYLNLGSVKIVLDNLIADQLIEPIIAVFIPPVERSEEYGTTKTTEYEQFIVAEVMPWLLNDFNIATHPSAHAITGPSLGGLISTQICYRNPEVFGLCGPFSPSYWVDNQSLMNEVIDGEVRDIKFYLDWGTYEPSIAATGNAMVNALEAKGYELEWSEWFEGHSWGSWRAHLDNMLTYFFPKIIIESLDQPDDRKDLGMSNYPNPFSTTTTIEFELARPGFANVDIFDVTGKKVGMAGGNVYLQGRQSIEFSNATLPSGIYFARLSIDKGYDTASIVVSR